MPSRVKSADRVLDLLELLARAGRPLSHADLARRAGIPKSSLSHLLHTLVERGYAVPGEGSASFELGPEAYSLARRGADVRASTHRLQAALDELSRRIGEPSAISVLRDQRAERICSARSDGARLYAMHVGVMAPLYASSAGKLLLADLPAAEREAYLARTPLRPLTEETITSAPVLRRHLDQARDEGVAWSLGEFVPGIAGVAVPVRGVHGRVLATLGAVVPRERLEAARGSGLVEALRACADAIRADVEALFAEPSGRQRSRS